MCGSEERNMTVENNLNEKQKGKLIINQEAGKEIDFNLILAKLAKMGYKATEK